MDLRKWLSGASGSPPSAPASPSVGYPKDSVPGVSPATNPGAHWFYQVSEELRGVLVAGGLSPDNTSTVQLLAALRALFGTVLSTAGVPYGIKLGSIYVQWGTYGSDVSEGAGPTVAFATAFPTACQAVFMQVRNTGSDGTSDAWMELKARSTTGFDTFCQWGGGGTGSRVVHGFDWLAIGY